MVRNVNQFNYPNGTTAVRPYPTLSTSSPIRPGAGLGNIAYIDSDSLSNYNALCVHNSQGSLARSSDQFDLRLVEVAGPELAGLAGALSTTLLRRIASIPRATTASRISTRAITSSSPEPGISHSMATELVDGWLLANITQLQSGNPLNVVTTSTYNGVRHHSTDACGSVTPPGAAQPWPTATFPSSRAPPARRLSPAVPFMRSRPALATYPATRSPDPALQTPMSRSRRPPRSPRQQLWWCVSMPSTY